MVLSMPVCIAKLNHIMNLFGKKVMLRALEPEDMSYLLEMINDPEMEKMVVGWSFPNSVITVR